MNWVSDVGIKMNSSNNTEIEYNYQIEMNLLKMIMIIVTMMVINVM